MSTPEQRARDAARQRVRRKQRRATGEPPPRHGTTYAYSICNCKCRTCQNANRIYHRDLRRRQGIPAQKFGRTHGLRSTYKSGCRCAACRKAEREYRRARRAGGGS